MNFSSLDEFIDTLGDAVRYREYSGGYIIDSDVHAALAIVLFDLQKARAQIIATDKFLEGDHGEESFLEIIKPMIRY